MIILGIQDSHDASACIVRDGELLVALGEERLQRIKGIGGFPHHAIESCLKATGISKKDIDHIAIATERIVPTNIHNISSTFKIEDFRRFNEEYYYPLLYENKKPKLIDIFPNYKPVGDLAYPIESVPFITTAELQGKEMEDIKQMRLEFTADYFDIDPSKISFYNHHRCHGLYAYYIKPNKPDKMVIVTSDSGGDRDYTSISTVENGCFKLISHSRNSLIGKIYTAVTLLLGMRPNEHEYKVMGLAPYASEYNKNKTRQVFLDALKVEGIDFAKNPSMKDFFFHFRDQLKNYRFDGIAGGLQDFVEIRLSEWFTNIAKKTSIADFIFSGGVANNVKANKTISELDCINSLFVPPGPGDESLSIGAAYSAIYDKFGAKEASSLIKPQINAYWGPDIDNKNHDQFKKESFIVNNYTREENCDFSKIAKVLAQGEVVALFQGKMEFGSRALGHRSLIADPSNSESVRKINDLIKKRDFWMPFTPSVLDEAYDDYVINKKNNDSSFMTMTYNSTDLGRKHLKAAMHPYDYTIRPQKVTKDTYPTYYNLIGAFKEITGIGALLNTSLNIHGKPIVMQPTDLLNEILLVDVPLKYILIDRTFYSRKS